MGNVLRLASMRLRAISHCNIHEAFVFSVTLQYRGIIELQPTVHSVQLAQLHGILR